MTQQVWRGGPGVQEDGGAVADHAGGQLANDLLGFAVFAFTDGKAEGTVQKIGGDTAINLADIAAGQ